MPKGVIAERGEEQALARESSQLHGSHRAAAGRLLPCFRRVHDLAGGRHALHPRELDPLDVPDYSDPHPQAQSATSATVIENVAR